MKIDYKTVGTWVLIVLIIGFGFWVGGIRTQSLIGG